MKNKFWSGERLESGVENLVTIEHLHRYAFATEFVNSNDVVVDIACGDGYGTNFISKKVKHVFGIDISEETVALAQKKYKNPNISFKVGSANSIPLEDKSVDLVVSFETIEHHDRHMEMMKEIRRILKPAGLLIISTPDKYFYSDVRGYNNPFHVKELYELEFKNMIAEFFSNQIFYFQRADSLSFIIPEGEKVNKTKAYKGNFEEIMLDSKWGPKIWISVASDQTIKNVEIGNFFLSSGIIEQQARNDAREIYTKSTTYIVGKFILFPFLIIKRMLKIILKNK